MSNEKVMLTSLGSEVLMVHRDSTELLRANS